MCFETRLEGRNKCRISDDFGKCVLDITLEKSFKRNIWKVSRRLGQKEKTKKSNLSGLGRIITEQIGRWNQMTAPRFQTGRGGGETSEESGLPLDQL